MSFDIDIGTTVGSFALAVKFTTDARRTVIFGPSGAGKSLTLQAIAGLLDPHTGRIAFDGDTVFDAAAKQRVPARQRRFGYLFQDYALFPQLTVRQNVGFGLQRGWRNPSRHARDPRVDTWLDAFELTKVADQTPRQLSGGQRQRTALARALAGAPRALLLDEPFAALDPALRERMRAELDALLARVDIPVLMITHDPQDVDWFGDEVLHLVGGRIASTTRRAA